MIPLYVITEFVSMANFDQWRIYYLSPLDKIKIGGLSIKSALLALVYLNKIPFFPHTTRPLSIL